MRIRVYYKDTDAGGIVYHSNYLDFCEMARSEYFFSAGKFPVINNCHFAVKKLEANFLSPAYLGDLLEVTTKLTQMKNASLNLFHEIIRDEKIIYTQHVTLVFLCQDGKPKKIPQSSKEFFKRLL